MKQHHIDLEPSFDRLASTRFESANGVRTTERGLERETECHLGRDRERDRPRSFPAVSRQAPLRPSRQLCSIRCQVNVADGLVNAQTSPEICRVEMLLLRSEGGRNGGPDRPYSPPRKTGDVRAGRSETTTAIVSFDQSGGEQMSSSLRLQNESESAVPSHHPAHDIGQKRRPRATHRASPIGRQNRCAAQLACAARLLRLTIFARTFRFWTGRDARPNMPIRERGRRRASARRASHAASHDCWCGSKVLASPPRREYKLHAVSDTL